MMKSKGQIDMKSLMMMMSLGLVLGLASAASAGDGALEISQACAVNGGCFAGDASGFPVTITTSGSYVLTSSLTATGQSAVSVQVDGASIDLNGFGIDCGGTGWGIDFDVARKNTSVRDGRIGNCTSGGLRAGDSAHIESVTADANGGYGFDLLDNAIVEGCTATNNGGIFAILVDNNSVVRGNVASGSVIGIGANQGSVVSNNVAASNVDGISANSAIVTGNAVFDNSDDGIVASSGSTVESNTVRANGAGTADGIGLSMDADTSYRANTVTQNVTGQVIGGVNTGNNHCAGPGTGLATCP